MTTRMAERTCVPCKGGIPPLQGDTLRQLLRELGGGWDMVDEHHLQKLYTFKDFRGPLDFTNAIGRIAEEQGHHPEITLTWGRVTVRIWTHKVNGLTESDFILAAKADAAFEQSGAKE